MNNQLSHPSHPFHIVDPSPWPLVTAMSCFLLTVGAAMYMHAMPFGGAFLLLGLSSVIACMIVWWRDVIRESTFTGHHVFNTQVGLRYGMLLFITSEIMFFFAFFWAFFHSSLSPAAEIGGIWPPVAIIPFNPWQVPLLNTLILLLSGATVTWAHHEIIVGRKQPALVALSLTIFLALLFTSFQAFEYLEARFNISDGVYGSTFYMATGFHGFHVIVGTIFLFICFLRLSAGHFTSTRHFGLEAAAWYWHFVDVVWLFLFVVVYWWGNSL